MPEITEADRAAAVRWGTGPVYNMDHLAQAFAAHREATEAAIAEDLRMADALSGGLSRVEVLRFADSLAAGAHRG